MAAIIAQYVGFSTLQNEVNLGKMKDKEIQRESQHNENELE
jgi:hypothetical protein